MNRQDLMKKLEQMFDEAERAALFGSIEIQFANGKPTILRKNSTTKLDGGNTRYEPRFELAEPRPAAEFLSDAQIIAGLKATAKWRSIFKVDGKVSTRQEMKEQLNVSGDPVKSIIRKKTGTYKNVAEFLLLYYHDTEEGKNKLMYEDADRDFCEIVAHYTMNPNQVMRLWQQSIIWRNAESELLKDSPDYHLKTVLEAVQRAHADADVRVDTTEKEEVTWLWAGYLPSSKLVIFDGDPGLSKSMFALRLAVSVMTGKEFINGSKPRSTGGVILLGAEDDLKDTIVPRLLAAGAPENQKIPLIHITVTRPDGSLFSLADPACLLELEMKIRQIDAKLVIIDPLNAFLGEKVDSNNDQKIRQVLGPLSELANRTGVVIFCLRHVTKAGGSKAMYRGLGSIGYTAASRAAFFAAKHPDKPGYFVVAATKFNLGPMPESLMYTLAFRDIPGIKDPVPYVATSEACLLSADDLASAPPENERKGKLDEAKEFLRLMLADGPVPKTEIDSRADKEGIKPKTLRDAKEALKIRAYQEGRRWFWDKPEGADWSIPF